MPTTVTLQHRTTYRYGAAVMLGPQTIRLRPLPLTRAIIGDYTLTIVPEPTALRWLQDASGNLVARALFDAPTDCLALSVSMRAELGEANPFDFLLDADAITWPFRYTAPLAHDMRPYLETDPIRPWMATLLREIALVEGSSVGLLVELNRLVFQRIAYITRMEPGVLSPEQTVLSGAGSCRDVAWLLIALARTLGFAARFVSGYLIQLADTSDTVDLHAWAEIYLPGAGWVGFDATSGLMTGAGHIPLAGSAFPEAAAPVSGTVGFSPAAEFDVETTLERVG